MSTVTIHYSEGAMWGNEGDCEVADRMASYAKFEQMMTKAIKRYWKNIDVSFIRGINDKVEIDDLYEEDYDGPDTEDVNALIERVWGEFDWIVE